MRQPLALALILTISAIPACAQRGGPHGGGFSAPHAAFSSHSAPAISNHSAPAFRGNFAAAPRYERPSSGPLSTGRPIPFRTPGPATSAFRISPAAARRPLYSRNRDRHPVRYGAGVPYVYPLWLGPSYFDDSADDPDTNSTDAPTPPDAYADLQPDPSQPMAAEPQQAIAEPSPYASDAVTLIFKDGRPAQQVRNYALTRTTLYVIGPHHRDIPVSDLDLAATEKANAEAGVPFQLPQPAP